MSKTVALGALINCDASLNCSAIVLLSNKPVSATCVSVTSVSAPKPNTAASDTSVRSSPTVASADIVTSPLILAVPFMSIVVAVRSISSVAPSDNTVALEPCINCVASLNSILFVLFTRTPVSGICVSDTSWSAPK